ncbi:MAG: hypothetical protein U1E65_28970 [Myxococcota bacterium]
MRRKFALSVLIFGSACAQVSVLDEQTMTTLGPGGGVASSADGLFSLEVAPGALATSTEISILTVRSTIPPEIAGVVYDLSQNNFAVPVGAKLYLSEPQQGFELVEISSEGLRAVQDMKEDLNARRLSGRLLRFARYGLRRHPHPRDGGVADVGTSTPAFDGGVGAVDAGTGTRNLCIEPSTLDFAHVALGQSRIMQSTIYNCGHQPERILNLGLLAGNAGFSNMTASDPQAQLPQTLGPGQQLTTTILFAPQVTGVAHDRLLIYTDSSSAAAYQEELVGASGGALGTCHLQTSTGTCTVTIQGDELFQITGPQTHFFEIDSDASCRAQASLVGLFSGFVAGTGTVALSYAPTPVDLLPHQTAWITHVQTSSAVGYFSLTDLRGQGCQIRLRGF